jgi:hypothetical protein
MKPSPIAPPRATRPSRVPSSDRAPEPSSSRPEEGPAPRVAGASSDPTRAAASLEPPGSTPSSSCPAAFDWHDVDQARTWLLAVRDAADDLAALAREGGRRLVNRVLSRAELRRQTRDAERSVHGLLSEAEAALGPRRE